MIVDLLAALRAVPKILDALERLGDIHTAHVAQQRKDEKDKAIIDLIAAAREAKGPTFTYKGKKYSKAVILKGAKK